MMSSHESLLNILPSMDTEKCTQEKEFDLANSISRTQTHAL